MTPISPPSFGGPLPRRLVHAQDHDALLGDLCEEYQRRRSKAWYFFQILAAIVIGSLRNVRTEMLFNLLIKPLFAVGVLAGAYAATHRARLA
jgi:hypothetical protein